MPLNWKSQYAPNPLDLFPQEGPYPLPTGDAAATADLTPDPGWDPRALPSIPSRGEAQRAFEYESQPPETSLGSIASMVLGAPGRLLLGADQELRGLLGGNTWEDQADQYRDFYDPTQKDIFDRDLSGDTRAFGHEPPVPGERLYKMLTGESQRVVHAGEDIYRQLQARRQGRALGIKERGMWQDQSQNILEGAKSQNELQTSLEFGRATALARLNKLHADIGRTGILNRKTLEEIHRLRTLLEPADQAKLDKLLHEQGVTEDLEAAVGDTGQAGADFRESLGVDETSSGVLAEHPNLVGPVLSNLPNARAAAELRANPIDPLTGLPKSHGSDLTAKLEDFKKRQDYLREHPPALRQKTPEQIREEERIRLEERETAHQKRLQWERKNQFNQGATRETPEEAAAKAKATAEATGEVGQDFYERRKEYDRLHGIGTGDRMPPEEYTWREKTRAYEKDVARDEKALYEGWYGKRGVLEAYKGRTRAATPNMFGGNLGESGADIAKEQKDLKKLYDAGEIDLGTALGVGGGAISFATAQKKLLQPKPSPRPTVEPYNRPRVDTGGNIPKGATEDTEKYTAMDIAAAGKVFDQEVGSSLSPNLGRDGKPISPGSQRYEYKFQQWYKDPGPQGWQAMKRAMRR